MGEDKKTVVELWFKKCASDIKTIENNLKAEEPPTDAICFHAQQAIEKCIKGAMVYYGEHVSRTHDLINLLNMVNKYIPELQTFENQLEDISRYGVEVRYPDLMSDDPTLEEAKKSFEIALQVRDIIKSKMK